MKRKIYISGPISGYDLNERERAFAKKKEELLKLGFAVANPMENGLSWDVSVHDHMRRDFEMLLPCDAIYMMRGWLKSAGCKVEFDVATACGMDVYFEDFARVGDKN